MKHEIEILDLPEGWEPVGYIIPAYGDNYLAPDGLVETCNCCMYVPRLVVRKKSIGDTTHDNTNNIQDIHDDGQRHKRGGLFKYVPYSRRTRPR